MLCDELKVYVPQDGPWGLEPEEGGKLVEEETCYLKSEVDAAIAELKQKLEERDKEIAKLNEERRWRKFHDEKPKWGEEVLVVDDESKQYIVRFSHDMKWISWGRMNTCESSAILYWRPLSSAPKEA